MTFIGFSGTLLRVTEVLLVTTLGQHTLSEMVPGKPCYGVYSLLPWGLHGRKIQDWEVGFAIRISG